MILRNIVNCLGACAFALVAGTLLQAQGPIQDHLIVTFTNPITIGDQTLAPGEYHIRQVPTASNPRILVFTSNSGMNVEAAVSAIPALQNNTARETKLTLKQRGDTYQLDKMWIAGKSYGYQFVTNDNLPAPTQAAQSNSMRMTATYAPPARQEVAQTQPPPQPEPQPEPAPAPAQAEPQPAAQPEPPPAPQQQPEPTPQQAEPRQAVQEPAPAMPATASHTGEIAVVAMLLGSAGLLLRRNSR